MSKTRNEKATSVFWYFLILLKVNHCVIACNEQVLPKAGYFLISSPELKINRITNAEKPFIDAAKQVKPELMMIEK